MHCSSPHDLAATTGPNEAYAVGNEGCASRAAINLLVATREIGADAVSSGRGQMLVAVRSTPRPDY